MALDLTAPKAPPRKTTARRATTPTKTAERADGVQGLFQLTAAGLAMFGQVADAGAIHKHSESVALETAKLAEDNASVARVVDYVCAVGPFAGLIAAVMPLCLQILANHNKIPAAAVSSFGVVDPRTLEAEIRLEAAKQQAQMMRAQADAERELARMVNEAEKIANGEPVS